MGKDDAILNAFKEDQTVEKISADRKLRVAYRLRLDSAAHKGIPL